MIVAAKEVLEGIAREIMLGYGDAELGEWQWLNASGVFQMQRRLSKDEEARVGQVVDVRGTPEAAQRLTRALAWLPREMFPYAAMEARGSSKPTVEAPPTEVKP